METHDFARNKIKFSGGTGVEHLTRYPKVEGLNPTICTSSWHRGRTFDSFSKG